MKEKKVTNKFSVTAVIIAVLMTVILFVVNIIGTYIDIKFDMTLDKAFSLTKITTNLLDSLDEPVEIHYLCDMEEIKAYNNADRTSPVYYTTALMLNTMEKLSEHKNVKFDNFDPEKNPGKVAKLDPDGELGVSYGDVIIGYNGNYSKVLGSTLMTPNEDGSKYYFLGENYICGAIQFLVNGDFPKVYFLDNSTGSYDVFKKTLTSQSYKVETLGLDAQEKIPADADILICANPREDISDKQYYAILDFLKNGGDMSFLMSASNAKVDFPNIEKIMKDYCIAMDYSRIEESDELIHMPNDQYSMITQLNEHDLTQMIMAQIQANALSPCVITNARSFYNLPNDTNDGLSFGPLIQTSDTAIAKPYGGTATHVDIPGPLYVSACAQDDTRKGSKLFVMGTADVISDENMSNSYFAASATLILNSISWMEDTAYNMSIPSTTQQLDYISIPNKGRADMLVVIIIIVPILIIGAGFVVWLRRRNA